MSIITPQSALGDQDVELQTIKKSPSSTKWDLSNKNLKNLRSLPSVILSVQIAFVTILDVSYNQLESLRGIAAFTLLEVLDASYNRIQVADMNTMVDVTKMTRLCSLDLSHNEIQRMELEEFGVNSSSRRLRLETQATRLTHLDLSFNKLMKLPDVRLAPSLEVLHLNNNLIEDLSDIENKFTLNHLHTLHLAGNRISWPHQMVPLAALAPTLLYLTISGNPFALSSSLAGNNNVKVVLPAEETVSPQHLSGNSPSCRWWRPLLLWLSPLLLSIDKVELSPAETQVAVKLFREREVLSKQLMELLNPSEKHKLPKYVIQMCGARSLLPEEAEEFLCEDEFTYTMSASISPTLAASARRKTSSGVKPGEIGKRIHEEEELHSRVEGVHRLEPIRTSTTGKEEMAEMDAPHFGEERNSEPSSVMGKAVEKTPFHIENDDEGDAKMGVKDEEKVQKNPVELPGAHQSGEAGFRSEFGAKKWPLDMIFPEEFTSVPRVLQQCQSVPKVPFETGGTVSPMGIGVSGSTFANFYSPSMTSTGVALSGNIPAVIKAMQSKLKTLTNVVEELWRVDMVRRAHAATVIQKYVRSMLVRIHLSPENAESCRFIRSQLSRQSNPMHLAALAEAAIHRSRSWASDPVGGGHASSCPCANHGAGQPNGNAGSSQSLPSVKGPPGMDRGKDVSEDLKEVLENMRSLQKVITTMWKDLEAFRQMAARERFRAAVAIQRHYRGYKARVLFGAMKENYEDFVHSLSPLVIIIQRCGRAMMSRRRLAREVLPQFRIQRLEGEVRDLRALLCDRLDNMEASIRRLLVPPQHREDVR